MTQSRQETASPDAAQLAKQKPATVMQSFITGSVAGAVEVGCNHPLWSLKTMVQRGEPFTLNPAVLYRGIYPNMASMVPISALQVGLNGYIQNVVLKKDATQLSNVERLGSAFVAGVGSAFVSCPTEMIMTYQNKNGGGFYAGGTHLAKRAGLSCLYTALPATATREGMFTASYLAVKPVLKAYIQDFCPNEMVASIVSGIFAGIGGALISQPVDTMKSAQQAADPLKPLSFNEAVRKHYAAYGVNGFFTGGFWRGARVLSAVVIMGGVTETMETQFRKR